MPGPIGNQHALGNEGGRPVERDRKEIAKQLLSWAELESSINLCGFCVSLKPPLPPQKLHLYAKESDEFREALQIAHAYLGERRERLLNRNKIHTTAYNLNARTYDYFLDTKKTEESQSENPASTKQQTILFRMDNGLGAGVNIQAEAIPA